MNRLTSDDALRARLRYAELYTPYQPNPVPGESQVESLMRERDGFARQLLEARTSIRAMLRMEARRHALLTDRVVRAYLKDYTRRGMKGDNPEYWLDLWTYEHLELAKSLPEHAEGSDA